MKGALWAVLGVLALIWSALAWFIYSLAGAGGAAVVGISRWLDIDPSTTQWLADGLSLAGGVAQWLVGIGWLMGIIVLAVVARLAARAEDAVRTASRHAEMAYGEPALEGELRYKKVSEARPVDRSTDL